MREPCGGAVLLCWPRADAGCRAAAGEGLLLGHLQLVALLVPGGHVLAEAYAVPIGESSDFPR